MIRIKSSKWDIEEAARYFFLCFGLINIALVILISIYLIIAGLPAIFEVGFFDFIFGTKWASAAAEPQFGILPFILTSFYGTGGAIVLGLPLGFFCAVYLAISCRHANAAYLHRIHSSGRCVPGCVAALSRSFPPNYR